MAVTLTGYGGVGEIGGNAFLLEAPGLRVMLDVGKRFGSAQTMQGQGAERSFNPSHFERRAGFADYFDGFQKVPAQNAVRDLAALELIPWGNDLSRLYRGDLGGAPGEPPVDLVLLSHAHVDHCGLLGLVRPEIPVATSPQTLATLASIEATGMGGWESDYTDLRSRGLEAKPDGGYGRVHYADDERGRGRTFVTAGKIPERGRWTIEFHAVDHSIQGAGGFILGDGDTRIVYSGDLRAHGLAPERTRRFLAAAAGCDVLLIEGTRVGDAPRHASTDRESDVEEQAAQFVERHATGDHPFVAVGYPPRDLDRLQSLWRVARRFGRRLLVTTKQAHLLSELRATGADLPDWQSDPHLGVYVGGSALVENRGQVPVANKQRLAVDWLPIPDEEWRRLASRELAGWEFSLLGGLQERKGSRRVVTRPVPWGAAHLATASDVARDPGGYVLSLSPLNMSTLFDIFPERDKGGGLYIHSLTQPHNDDMEMDQFRLRRWLRAFHLNAPDFEPRRTHVSGHLSQEDLASVLDDLQPKLVVPIHTDRPDLTSERYQGRTGKRALVPRYGVAETLA
ncbi:MAG: MBL fold metallo-hydrolase [Thermoplasmatota archaeon]